MLGHVVGARVGKADEGVGTDEGDEIVGKKVGSVEGNSEGVNVGG